MLPVVDLNARKVVHVDRQVAAPEVPKDSVNYHRGKVGSNTYLATEFRFDPPRPLDITQPEGPSFSVNGSAVSWQRWSLRVGFNYREGLVLHDVRQEGTRIQVPNPTLPRHPPSSFIFGARPVWSYVGISTGGTRRG